MTNYDNVKGWVVGVFILAIFILAFLVIKPIVIPIVFGLLFAYIFSPVYKKILSWVKWKNLSASLLMIGLAVLTIIPIVYFVPIIVKQVFGIYVLLQKINMSNFLNKFLDAHMSIVMGKNLNNIIGQTFSGLINNFTSLIVDLPSLLLQLAVFLFTFYFAIRDSYELKRYVSSLSPFSAATEKKFMKEFRGITNGIIYGQVFVGILQGLLVGAGLLLLGFPEVMTLTFLACAFAIIPILGSWVVWFPIGIMLLVKGEIFSGVFLLLYGIFFVSTIDNILKPYILSKRSNLPISLSIIGIIGGLYFFGISGLILGPLVLAYVLIIIEFYRQGNLKDLFIKNKNEIKN